MGGKSGPLWGPRQVDEFMVPYCKRCVQAAKAAGARLFNVDSDGDCRAILPGFVRAGINMFHPCEPADNMDMVELRARFGTALAFEGGIDKYALLGTKEDIDRELRYRVPPMVASGTAQDRARSLLCRPGSAHRLTLDNSPWYDYFLLGVAASKGVQQQVYRTAAGFEHVQINRGQGRVGNPGVQGVVPADQ
jgi:hypothetical protein